MLPLTIFRCNGPNSVVIASPSITPMPPDTVTPSLCEPKGPLITRDELEGTELLIECPNGCIEIEKVLFDCPPMTRAFSENHKDIVARACQHEDGRGREDCVVKANNEFFGTSLDCENGPAKLWLKFR